MKSRIAENIDAYIPNPEDIQKRLESLRALIEKQHQKGEEEI